MNKQLKPIPKFKNEQTEDAFWQQADSTEYIDYTQLKPVQFPNLKLTSKLITIRLPQSLIDRLKITAHQMDIPYQSLIKQLLFHGLQKNPSQTLPGYVADK
jgi:predicted DNA binding CopG/RHH family protein